MTREPLLHEPPLLRSSARRPAPRRRRGLTLVEIMVVIAILGTLMAVVAVNVTQHFTENNVETTRLQLTRLAQALDTHAARNRGRYPTTDQGLEAIRDMLPDGRVPTDAWGNPIQYQSPAPTGSRPYEIMSYGADGEPGGEGADADLRLGYVPRGEA